MRDNVRHFVQLLMEVLDLPEPVIEIGSLQIEGQEALGEMRPFFTGRAYLGCDMRPGPGVECLADAHRLPFRDGSAGTVLLLDTLEHVLSPAVAVQEACRAAKEGGVVVLVSVMNFPIHSYPSDYWRFTPAVFDYLLQPLRPRFVLSQGDAEFPHTIVGLAVKQSTPGEAGEHLCAAAGEIQARWPEMMHGGPLLLWEPSAIVLSQRLNERALPELERGCTIEQTFVCPSDGLSRIDLPLSTQGRANFSHVLFRLREADGDGREVAAYRLFAPHILDGAWASVPVPLQLASAGRRYILAIASPDATPEQTIAPLASELTAYHDGQLSINGEPVEGSLCFQVYCRSDEDEMPRVETPSPLGAPLRASGDAEDPGWQQTRYLASIMEAGFDRLHADIKDTEARLAELRYVQQQTLEQSAEAAALARAVKRNPLFALWKRIAGGRRPDRGQ